MDNLASFLLRGMWIIFLTLFVHDSVFVHVSVVVFVFVCVFVFLSVLVLVFEMNND